MRRHPLADLARSRLAPVILLIPPFTASACATKVVVGERYCAEAPADASPAPAADSSVDVPWSTGFEDGWCEYAQPSGFCYTGGAASFSIVTSPVHSGNYAAAFYVDSNPANGSQARCVQQGQFPGSAYYGAWYYVPPATNNALWNLFHFQGADGGGNLHGLWDVSLGSQSDGGLQLFLYDFLSAQPGRANDAPLVPIGQWFHIEVFFKRASDDTGELDVWQDGEPIVQLSGLATDDSTWGQWYVGNLASGIVPSGSIVYVDDVTISTSMVEP